MKKISKIALVAVVAAMTAFFGCNSEPSILEKVAPVSDLQAKAFPGLNVVTWKPNAVSNGYTLFANYGRGWESKGSFTSSTCSFYDFISTRNEWANGQEVKYMIQNDGDKLARAAYVNKELVSSDFVEVSVNAVNPGYKAEVIYKLPAAEEGKAIPDFMAFDYLDEEAVAGLVEPVAAEIKTTEDLETIITGYVKAPYLKYEASVRGPDENEKLVFDFYTDETGEWVWDEVNQDYYLDNEMSLLGNVTLGTPFIGTNDVYITISAAYDYYTPKTIKVASFEVAAAAAWDLDDSFAAAYVIEDEKVEFTWNPATNNDNSVASDVNYVIYYEVDGKWKKVAVKPVYDAFEETYSAAVDFSDDMEGQFVLVATKDGELDYAYANPVYEDQVQAPDNNSVTYQVVDAIADEDGNAEYARTIRLVFNPYTFNGKYTTKVTYKIFQKEYEEGVAVDDLEWKDTGASVSYNAVTGKMVSSDITPKIVTDYKVVPYGENGRKLSAYATKQFYDFKADEVVAATFAYDSHSEGKFTWKGTSGTVNKKADVIPTFEAYQIKTDLNELNNGEGAYEASVAAKVNASVSKEAADENGNVAYTVTVTAAAKEGYTVYLYTVETVDGENVYTLVDAKSN